MKAEDAASLEALLSALTLDEKARLCAGASLWTGHAVPRLGIPALRVTDGPNGARGSQLAAGPSAACFPCGSALAATWNPELVEAVGAALGEEARTKRAHVLLAPTVNMHRSPLGGRHFEGYSEDPFLAARSAAAFVRGVQSQRVAACVKHFVANDSEFERMTISSEVDARTLRELSLPPFEAAIREAGAWAVMAAYNGLNGATCSANAALLVELLRHEWGFDGVVMSDWYGTRDTVASARNGLDLEMPGPPRFFGSELAAAVQRGEVSETLLDEKVRRILRLLARTGALDEAPGDEPERAIDRADHRALARRAARESIVLLRNERGVLPLRRELLRRLAVIGPNARRTAIQGGGSARVTPHYETNVLDAIRAAVGAGVEIVHAEGCTNFRRLPVLEDTDLTLQVFASSDLSGAVLSERRVRRPDFTWLGSDSPVPDAQPFSARLAGKFLPERAGMHRFSLTCVGRARLFVGSALVVDDWTAPVRGDSYFGLGNAEASGEVALEAKSPVELVVEYAKPAPGIGGLRLGHHAPGPGDPVAQASSLARSADAAVVVIGLDAEWESEGGDRADLRLPGRQDELVAAVARAQPLTAVVVNAGAPVEMPWAEHVPAVLCAWYGGQEVGNAVADVLFGADPSGRLPTTIPLRLEDVACHAARDPSVYPGRDGRVVYAEGVFSGYRHFDAHGIAPLFAFGHGLSYARFEYGRLGLSRARLGPGDSVVARVEVRNTGERAGTEVVQLYVADLEASGLRPPQALAGFAKLTLAPGEAKSVSLQIEPRAFCCYDAEQGRWIAEPGTFELRAGRSSRDIRARARLQLE